jgi:hypothetical protein
LALSRRPPAQGIWGPPMCSIATHPANLCKAVHIQGVNKWHFISFKCVVSFVSLVSLVSLTSTNQRSRSTCAWPWQVQVPDEQPLDQH